ncbi:VWA-like domain-containing protein [Flammeovirga sp. SJP92]|uniref:vWA domain-containing protein n=1 Tax=Flammeovirga sp. SJP92 TaxID=1775430 RepID=UPI000789603A|nr:VWA-like domain-containing protein [Flammeovirga sp. SJP92]KXX70467.1 hypothetical protein AVL50_08905 [Flammeovirga sp. SJP92]
MTNTLEEVSKTSIQLILKEPFYGHFFTGLLKEVTERIDTAAVTIQGHNAFKLLVNEEFWQSLTDKEQRYGLIKHEILHIVLKHLHKYKDYEHKYLYNIAADLVVNQYIQKHQLPEGGITLERFADLEKEHNFEFERNKDVGYYYHILKKLLGKTSAGTSSESKEKKAVASPDYQLSINDLLDDDNSELKRHQLWKEIESLTEGETKILDININELLKQTAQRLKSKGNVNWWGSLPAGLSVYLQELFKSFEPSVDWRRVLRLFTSSSSKTFLKNTLKRPSKRYGTTPGIKIKRKNKLLVAIDTSGSVSNEELMIFFGEIYHIWKQGAEIHIVECDVIIHKKYRYNGTPPNVIHGRGGTSFEAPIEYANTELHPDCIVYFTDGYAPPPSVHSRYPLLWMITQSGIDEDSTTWNELSGRKVRMKN